MVNERDRAAGSRSSRSLSVRGSAPFTLPPNPDDALLPHEESAKETPEPTDADAKYWHPRTSPLDFESWPWKAVPPDTVKQHEPQGRVSADQTGWRSKAEQARTLQHSFRGWADPAGKEVARGQEADVTHGIWTCCSALSVHASGCASSRHSADWGQCGLCGHWIPLARWTSAKCVSHPGEPVQNRFGGVRWSCCGGTGYEGSRADYKAAQARC